MSERNGESIERLKLKLGNMNEAIRCLGHRVDIAADPRNCVSITVKAAGTDDSQVRDAIVHWLQSNWPELAPKIVTHTKMVADEVRDHLAELLEKEMAALRGHPDTTDLAPERPTGASNQSERARGED